MIILFLFLLGTILRAAAQSDVDSQIDKIIEQSKQQQDNLFYLSYDWFKWVESQYAIVNRAKS